jgi:hypothetical protein
MLVATSTAHDRRRQMPPYGRKTSSTRRRKAKAIAPYLHRSRHKVTGLQGLRAESPLKSTVVYRSSKLKR